MIPTSRMIMLAMVLAAAACTPPATLRLEPRSVVDATIPSNAVASLTSVIVLPPQGSDRGSVTELADVERVLLGAGIKVISSGITGRIVLDATGNRVVGGAELSDLERALVLARNSNAGALLQVANISWTSGYRPFVRRANVYEEAEIGSPLNGADIVRIEEPVFHFEARLIDVESGEIRASFDISQSTSRVVPSPKQIDFQPQFGRGTDQDITTDNPERRRVVIGQVMGAFLARIQSRGAVDVPAPADAGAN